MHNKITLCLTLSLALCLTGCSTSHKDGPPRYRVDVSRIPNAVPKKEPLAKYGNMRSYKVFGKRYHTLRSSKDYDKTGIASWYGTKFHDRKTSSGEPYNMLSMTAAHKSLPLPTYVEVTNLRNHRKVIVKVNDRGPFSSNRIIDLSYVAAKKLGMVGRGTTKVRVRAINPSKFNKHTLFAYLQVGAFKNRAHAKQLKDQLADKLNAPITIAKPNNHSGFYRVRVGPLKNHRSLKRLSAWFKRRGMDTLTIS